MSSYTSKPGKFPSFTDCFCTCSFVYLFSFFKNASKTQKGKVNSGIDGASISWMHSIRIFQTTCIGLVVTCTHTKLIRYFLEKDASLRPVISPWDMTLVAGMYCVSLVSNTFKSSRLVCVWGEEIHCTIAISG
jgi:hypothetical protein